jgi:hypothetical protein
MDNGRSLVPNDATAVAGIHKVAKRWVCPATCAIFPPVVGHNKQSHAKSFAFKSIVIYIAPWIPSNLHGKWHAVVQFRNEGPKEDTSASSTCEGRPQADLATVKIVAVVAVALFTRECCTPGATQTRVLLHGQPPFQMASGYAAGISPPLKSTVKRDVDNARYGRREWRNGLRSCKCLIPKTLAAKIKRADILINTILRSLTAFVDHYGPMAGLVCAFSCH